MMAFRVVSTIYNTATVCEIQYGIHVLWICNFLKCAKLKSSSDIHFIDTGIPTGQELLGGFRTFMAHSVRVTTQVINSSPKSRLVDLFMDPCLKSEMDLDLLAHWVSMVQCAPQRRRLCHQRLVSWSCLLSTRGIESLVWSHHCFQSLT